MKAAGPKKKPKKTTKESKQDGAVAAAASSADAPDQEKRGADLLDQAEEREAYRLKLSKWADGALKTIKSPLFWLFLHVSSQARSPLSHFFAWAQKNSDERLIQQLVTGRAQEFQEEFDKLIQTFSTWFAAAAKDAGAEGLPAELMNLARTLAFKLVVHASASFSMRVTTPMQRYPYKLFWMLKRQPFSRCSERQRIAQEILDSAPELLESNCRKLKFLYLSELRFVAKEGRFDQNASEQGSRLYAVISTMSELLKGDTQLVESINSIIRLISTRCPSIDLETLSARITVKKALTSELPASGKGKGYANKRWSVVSSHAKPLLMELTLAGTAYRQTLDNVKRFSQPMRTTMPALESTLQNTDLSRALPDIRRTPQKQWVSSQATKLKASIDAARRESARLKAFEPLRPACLTVFCIRCAADHQKQDFYLQLLTYRSLLLVVRLKCEADGSLCLPQHSGTEIFTTVELLTGLHSGCFDPVAPQTFEVFCMSAMHVDGARLMCLDEKSVNVGPAAGLISLSSTTASPLGQKAITHIKMEKVAKATAGPVAAAPEGIADAAGPTDSDLLNSGYGFAEDVENSNAEAAKMDEELGTELIEAEKAARIRKAVSGKKKPGAQLSGTAPSTGLQCTDVSLLDEAVQLVENMHSHHSLSRDELEEEAVLMLVRAAQAKPPASGQADEMQQLLVTTPERKRSQQQYACFEDDQSFLQHILGSGDQDAEDADAYGSDPEEAGASVAQPVAALAVTSEGASSPVKVEAAAECQLKKTKRAAALWAKSFSATLGSILDRSRRMQLGLGHNEEVSLLATRPCDMLAQAFSADGADTYGQDSALEIVCVKWTDPVRREGRTVRIDAKSRVVWAPAQLFGKAVPTQSFPMDEYTDLLHASGAQSRRYKGNCRDGFPEHVIRFVAFCRLICSYANQAPRSVPRTLSL
ncbi:unnamed protein product [Symbiodinium sp. CCMP2456]|nr:unnamed protein product [Symbiodinium sp. CCMP2456]